MNPKKYRWSKVYESAEEELIELLRAKRITAERHEVDSYETKELPPRTEVTRLWSVEGTAFAIIDGVRFSMQPGDVLDIPSQKSCIITTAFSPFAWYESYAKLI